MRDAISSADSVHRCREGCAGCCIRPDQMVFAHQGITFLDETVRRADEIDGDFLFEQFEGISFLEFLLQDGHLAVRRPIRGSR